MEVVLVSGQEDIFLELQSKKDGFCEYTIQSFVKILRATNV